MRDEFIERNLKLWNDKVNEVFEGAVPETYTWTSIEEIVLILNKISGKNLNHVFYPNGGGLDITKVETSHEDGCIKLYCDTTFDVVKPVSLTFNSFNGLDELSYFRLETSELAPSGVYDNLTSSYEELVCLDNNRYIDRSYWDAGSYYEDGVEKKFTDKDTVVSRIFSGSFVFFAKASLYNRISATYDARHNKMSSEQFHDYIKLFANKIIEKKEIE